MIVDANVDVYSYLKIEMLLASGMTANVYLAALDGKKVVIKISRSSVYEKYFNKEMEFIKKMPKATNIIKVFGYGKVNNPEDRFYKCNYIVMEYASKGDLVTVIEEKKQLREAELKEILLSIINGIGSIHKAGFIHRDLKPENILISDTNEYLITDFGFADEIGNLSTERRGTEGYIAPEILSKQSITFPEAIDVFSLGVIAYILATGEFPFTNANKEDGLYKFIMSNNWEDYWKIVNKTYLSKSVKEILQRMLCVEPEKRYSLKELANHPWFSN